MLYPEMVSFVPGILTRFWSFPLWLCSGCLARVPPVSPDTRSPAEGTGSGGLYLYMDVVGRSVGWSVDQSKYVFGRVRGILLQHLLPALANCLFIYVVTHETKPADFLCRAAMVAPSYLCRVDPFAIVRSRAA